MPRRSQFPFLLRADYDGPRVLLLVRRFGANACHADGYRLQPLPGEVHGAGECRGEAGHVREVQTIVCGDGGGRVGGGEGSFGRSPCAGWRSEDASRRSAGAGGATGGSADANQSNGRSARRAGIDGRVYRADGTVEELSPDGSLLGVFAEEVFEQTTTQLHPGDRLLLYSDGFELAFRQKGESVTDHRQIGSERYTDELRDLAHGTIDEAMGRLAHKVDHGAGSLNQIDDLTAIAIGVRTTVPAATAA